MFGAMIGVRAPEFIGNENDWINTHPLRMSDLRGKIVLIDFWDYTCINCIRTLPYLREWHNRYKDKGLVIVGIHTPEFEFAKDRENVEEAVEKFGIDYPVLLDPDYENWQAYANRYWPRKYIVDADGKIVYDHAGEGAYGDTENVIQQLLKEINPDVELPQLMEPVTGEGKPGAVCYPVTPELYAGYRRGIIGSPEGYKQGEVVEYTDPGEHEDGVIYARGPFYIADEYLRHAKQTEYPKDYIAIRYHAIEVNAVMRPAKGEFDVLVTQDGKPIDLLDAGTDVYLADGNTWVTVDEPRMYRIVKNREFGSHELRLASNSDSFTLYAFTFGSCEQAQP
ncbi:MAG TPA: redoxin domain-containing protein [Armatimonadota bacterium]|nr:redoxin domain-containing protein [Armatimonadota bacterium]